MNVGFAMRMGRRLYCAASSTVRRTLSKTLCKLAFGIPPKARRNACGTAVVVAKGYGFTYLASLAEVSLRAPNDRARATAGLFVYAYFGFSLPVIASGILADRLGLLSAMIAFAVAQSIATALIIAIWVKRTSSWLSDPYQGKAAKRATAGTAAPAHAHAEGTPFAGNPPAPSGD